jgi:hypothetical protein
MIWPSDACASAACGEGRFSSLTMARRTAWASCPRMTMRTGSSCRQERMEVKASINIFSTLCVMCSSDEKMLGAQAVRKITPARRNPQLCSLRKNRLAQAL